MKKLIALMGAGAMLLTVAGPAFAGSWSMTVNRARVSNDTSAVASTGIGVGNVATVDKAHVLGSVEVKGNNAVMFSSTGDAESLAVGGVVANTQVGCSSCGEGFTVNKAKVRNTTSAQSLTGISAGNGAAVEKATIGGWFGGEVEVSGNNTVVGAHTGDASSLGVGVVVVNTSVSFPHR